MLHYMRDHDRFLQAELSRRAVLKGSIAGLSGLVFGSQAKEALSVQAAGPPRPPRNLRIGSPVQVTETLQDPTGLRAAFPIPPLFCIAYINPDLSRQANQESIVARYPLTLVPQEMRPTHVQWRDRIKHLNPRIMMLGYQMVIEETEVPGPGHEAMQKVKDAWCKYPGGFNPTIKVRPTSRDLRLFDPRKGEWQEAFIEACGITLKSYPYNGLFLDQCSVFEKAHPSPAVKAEMRQALQDTLLRLRGEFPDTVLIGNSRYNWQGLNGELNEGRTSDMPKEVAPFDGHVQPYMDLYESILKDPNDIERVKREMTLAHSQGAFYSAAVNAQHVLWFDVFDEIMAQYK